MEAVTEIEDEEVEYEEENQVGLAEEESSGESEDEDEGDDDESVAVVEPSLAVFIIERFELFDFWLDRRECGVQCSLCVASNLRYL